MNQVSTNEVSSPASGTVEIEPRSNPIVESRPLYEHREARCLRWLGATALTAVVLGTALGLSHEKGQARLIGGDAPKAMLEKSGDLAGPQVQFLDVVASDSLQAEQVEFVYAQPSDANLNCSDGQADVRQRINRIQNYLARQAPGLALTVAESGGQPTVGCLTLEEKARDIISGPDFLRSVIDQVHSATFNYPNVSTIYSLILGGAKPT